MLAAISELSGVSERNGIFLLAEVLLAEIMKPTLSDRNRSIPATFVRFWGHPHRLPN